MSATRPGARLRDRNLLAALALAALILLNAFQPGYQPPAPWGFDKLLHFAYYGLVATIILRARWVSGHPYAAYIAVVAATALGFADEALQSLSPRRHASLWDAMADFAGAAIAVPLYLKAKGY
jgi:VanZ family protein